MRNHDNSTLHTLAIVALGVGFGAMAAAGLIAFALMFALALGISA